MNVTSPAIETRIHARKKQIADKALKLFVTHGYDETSVEDIARACAMSKGNFYHYFDSKEELIYLIQRDIVQEQRGETTVLAQKVADNGHEKALGYFIERYYRSVDRHQDAYNFLNHVIVRLGSKGRRQLLRGSIDVQELFERLILAGIAEGVFRDVNAKLVAHNIVRLGSAWANNRWHLRKFMTIEGYITEQVQYLLSGIAAEKSAD